MKKGRRRVGENDGDSPPSEKWTKSTARSFETERGERELFGGTAKGLDDVRVDLGGGEGAASGYVSEASISVCSLP